MRTSNTVLKNWYHQEEGGPLPETSFGWYNTPFGKNLKTNVGKYFFKLLK